MPEDLLPYLWLSLSAVAAGAMNAIAGGGTLLTFPALLAVLSGSSAGVVANATSTVALTPGSLAGAWAYRDGLRPRWRLVGVLAVPSVIGGGVGSVLVAVLDPQLFAALVPWLVLVAAVLFAVQPAVGRWLRREEAAPAGPTARATAAVVFFQLLVAVYGGYFGAGIGILMLASLGFLHLGDLHAMNAVKNFLAACINVMAIGVFVATGKVEWRYAGVMALSSMAGSYTGARLASRVRPAYVRAVVIVIGFGLAAYFFYDRWVAKS